MLDKARSSSVRTWRRSAADLTEGMHWQHSVAAEPAHQRGLQIHGPACRADKLTAAACCAQISSHRCAEYYSIPLLLQSVQQAPHKLWGPRH